ncbi:Apoptosis facilitator [Collichthys lucidus]|uniref:Apoptosis facilitator n=1 Tax=Collichthys lucidus TaxID=240159 RepID=A0A4U5UC08_COLLU|nr:Apoptosis facilitator [Collichthys lucidus]
MARLVWDETPTMETQTENQRPNNGQLIYVPHKDTIRLLEVYVKRSLSLNDWTLKDTKLRRKEKWVTMPRKQRRHSSDPSLHLADGFNYEEIGTFSAVETPANQPKELNVLNEKSEKPTKKSKKSKKPSFWKNLFGIFYRKSNEDKDEDEDSPSEIPEGSQGEELFDSATTCLPTTPVPLQKRKSMRRKSIKRRFSKRRLSSIKHNKSIKELNPADITRVEAAVSVEATYSYYEKVSQELERIVQEVQVKEEVKPLSDEEVINRIIALTKEQGDAIDDKLKDNPTLNNFFQRMSYSSFQKLADAYLENEATPTHNPPTVPPTAPELVKLALTYDFTAKIARLSKQNLGHITGLGNRYLQDRFEYKQACTDHLGSDSDS